MWLTVLSVLIENDAEQFLSLLVLLSVSSEPGSTCPVQQQ